MPEIIANGAVQPVGLNTRARLAADIFRML